MISLYLPCIPRKVSPTEAPSQLTTNLYSLKKEEGQERFRAWNLGAGLQVHDKQLQRLGSRFGSRELWVRGFGIWI